MFDWTLFKLVETLPTDYTLVESLDKHFWNVSTITVQFNVRTWADLRSIEIISVSVKKSNQINISKCMNNLATYFIIHYFYKTKTSYIYDKYQHGGLRER